MTTKRWTRAIGAITVGVLFAFVGLVGTLGTANAQQPAEGEVSVYFVAFACPNIHAELYPECEIVTGAVFSVEADGVELGPFTTGPTSLVAGFSFNAPVDATLTITEIDNIPEGYVPAPGFDPLVVDVADLPEVGCGGESTCPGIEFVNLATGGPDDNDDGSEIGGDVSLPQTGVGTVAQSAATSTLPLAAGLSILLGVGAITLRRRAFR